MKTYAVFNDYFFKNNHWWIPKKLKRVICNRSNPRSKDYMNSLLKEKFPDVEIIGINNINNTENVEKIILLYPDSIGLGWSNLEKEIIKNYNVIEVLNGRKRHFKLSKEVRIELLFKRFLEITFLPEILFTPVLIIYGIFLHIKHKIFGSA